MSNIQFDKMEHLAQWLVVEALVNKYPDIRAETGVHPDENGNLDIKFSVNGIELPFEEVIDAIDAQFDRMIEDKAKEMLLGRLGDAKERIVELIFGESND